MTDARIISPQNLLRFLVNLISALKSAVVKNAPLQTVNAMFSLT